MSIFAAMPWIVIALAACTLVPAFFTFDALVKRQYEVARPAWESDGRPIGFWWRPPGGMDLFARLASQLATNRCMMRWGFRRPEWVAADAEALRLHARLRGLFIAWNVGMALFATWFVLSRFR